MTLLRIRGVVFTGLKEKFTEALRRDDVKAIVLTGNRLILPFFGSIFAFKFERIDSFADFIS